MTEYRYIKTTGELEELCERLADEPHVAVDTEFIGDRTYFRRLEIIQSPRFSVRGYTFIPLFTRGNLPPSGNYTPRIDLHLGGSAFLAANILADTGQNNQDKNTMKS